MIFTETTCESLINYCHDQTTRDSGGDTAFRTTDQKVRGSNPFERAITIGSIPVQLVIGYHVEQGSTY